MTPECIHKIWRLFVPSEKGTIGLWANVKNFCVCRFGFNGMCKVLKVIFFCDVCLLLGWVVY